MAVLQFDERPILVFWETTRACLLACKHCRAEAVKEAPPGELSTQESLNFIDTLTSFGRPYPVLILTGGDVMMRPDVFTLARHAKSLGIPIGMAPSVTPRLTINAISKMKEIGVKVVSISLDGACASTHEGIRGIPGHFEETVQRIRQLVEAGFEVQVNTAVMRENVHEMPAIVEILKDVGVHIWEVFFLIEVGRGRQSSELSPSECAELCHFLYDASTYDITVRTVEAPFFRPIIASRKAARNATDVIERTKIADRHQIGPMDGHYVSDIGKLYDALSLDLTHRLGSAISPPRAQTSGTRDGKGIIFVSSDGTVYPAGFLPLPLGNIRNRPLSDIYRNHPVLKDIRAANFSGKCGICEYKHVCGGSRSRAYAKTSDPLSEDPACAL